MFSGKVSCQFHIAEIWMRNIKPCPPELSSYFEGSHTCVSSKVFIWIQHLVCFCKSFADSRCSGRESCQFRVTDIMHNNIKPCPLELSSYFEASYICIPSKQNQTFSFFLQSFADGMCSGKGSCKFRVSELMHTDIEPCPLELSSYLEAIHSCTPSKSNISCQLSCVFAKLCRWDLFWKANLCPSC